MASSRMTLTTKHYDPYLGFAFTYSCDNQFSKDWGQLWTTWISKGINTACMGKNTDLHLFTFLLQEGWPGKTIEVVNCGTYPTEWAKLCFRTDERTTPHEIHEFVVKVGWKDGEYKIRSFTISIVDKWGWNHLPKCQGKTLVEGLLPKIWLLLWCSTGTYYKTQVLYLSCLQLLLCILTVTKMGKLIKWGSYAVIRSWEFGQTRNKVGWEKLANGVLSWAKNGVLSSWSALLCDQQRSS